MDELPIEYYGRTTHIILWTNYPYNIMDELPI